ncbi:MAG: hypothetical protein M1813_004917 [Trichoglossum hirsutum]|nr:MAG: hypothetical protein M1813_004917 [Trichoglossum hirsutum]
MAGRRPTAAAAAQVVRIAAQSRDVSSSAAVFGLKESARDVENRHVEVEIHKQDLLRKQKDGQGHWKEELASDSESNIKADRGEVNADQEIAKLQEKTRKLAHGAEKII